MFPAARVTDMHVCPMVTGVVPHVGGPILPPGAPTVLIMSLPAARVTDMCTCVGPPDVIVMGSMTVLIMNLPAARLTSQCAHGGLVGLPTLFLEVRPGDPDHLAFRHRVAGHGQRHRGTRQHGGCETFHDNPPCTPVGGAR